VLKKEHLIRSNVVLYLEKERNIYFRSEAITFVEINHRYTYTEFSIARTRNSALKN